MFVNHTWWKRRSMTTENKNRVVKILKLILFYFLLISASKTCRIYPFASKISFPMILRYMSKSDLFSLYQSSVILSKYIHGRGETMILGWTLSSDPMFLTLNNALNVFWVSILSSMESAKSYLTMNLWAFIFIIFLLLKDNTWHPQIKTGKVCFGSQSVEDSVPSQLAPRQGTKAEEKWLVHGGSRKQRPINGRLKETDPSRSHAQSPTPPSSLHFPTQ